MLFKCYLTAAQAGSSSRLNETVKWKSWNAHQMGSYEKPPQFFGNMLKSYCEKTTHMKIQKMVAHFIQTELYSFHAIITRIFHYWGINWKALTMLESVHFTSYICWIIFAWISWWPSASFLRQKFRGTEFWNGDLVKCKANSIFVQS